MTDRKLPVIYAVTQLDRIPVVDAHGRGVFVTHTRADEALTPFEPAVPRCKTCDQFDDSASIPMCRHLAGLRFPLETDHCSRHSELRK